MPRAKKPKVPTEVEFDFIKSNYFRVIHADGVFGGLAPNGSIHMEVYSERAPIPQKLVHPIQDGKLGPELTDRRQGRKAIVREVEVDIIFDIAQAVILRAWLDEKITQYQQMVGPLPVVTVVGQVATVDLVKPGVNAEGGKGKSR